MHHLPQFLIHSKAKSKKKKEEEEEMDRKQKRRKPKLDRRNAVKNIDYDATPSSSSSLSSPPTSSFSSSYLDDDASSLVTRSLDLSDKTSFRIEGSDGGEFARICRSLGLTGPDDFAIPAAAWEARKQRSSSDLLPRSRLIRLDSIPGTGDLQEEAVDEGEVVGVLADRFVDSVNLNNQIESTGGGGIGRGAVADRFVDSVSLTINKTESTSGGGGIGRGAVAGGGIKGVRPPFLAPPPSLLRPVIDDACSTWDLFRSFGPDSDGGGTSVVAVGGYSSYEDEDEDVNNREILKRDEMRGARREETAEASESCSFTTSNDDDSSSTTTTEPTANNSPIGRLVRNIANWEKGERLGQGSFGTVYEGISE